MTSESNHDPRHSIDIRAFVVILVAAMAISFGCGVGMGPTAEQLLAANSRLPPVTSVDLSSTIPPPGGGDEELHEPAGQHLLVDMKGLEADFLDSEARLSKAMVETVQECGLTLLSYHCHKLIPKGVSCVGVLLESHISFHTWPDEGVITLDLFTCGNKPLIPAVKTIQLLFGINRRTENGKDETIQLQWSHELRGFRSKSTNKEASTTEHNYAVLDHASDLAQMIWSPIDCVVKDQIISTLTKYQRVDMWDIVSLEETPTYEDVLKHDLQPGDPRWTTSELVTPTRYLFLDGVLQSESASQHEFHEALVHPALFSHAGPKQVAIVGGAEGATLREVLKHKTIDAVTMVEIDEELVSLVQEHMPFMSDCSDLVGIADNCFEDPKTTLVVEDAQTWFVNRSPEQPKFDVVLIDALEPELGAFFSKSLFDSAPILSAFLDSMSSDGILAIQIGRAPTILDPRPDIGFNAPRETLFRTLESLPSVQAMFVYEDPHCGFLEPRAFMIVCKDVSCRERFYGTADEMDYQVYDRIVQTHSKERALNYFDGVTHLAYQVAPKAWETIYCRREPTPFECNYRHLDFAQQVFEFNVKDVDNSPFRLTAQYENDDEENGKVTETHVFATVDIPKGSYIMPEHLAASLSLSHTSIKNLKQDVEYGGAVLIDDFVTFVEENGHDSQSKGSARRLIEIGASYFIKESASEEESNVGRWLPPHPEGVRPKYSPVYERHRLSFDVFMVATKDIAKDEELVRFVDMWASA